MTSEVRQKQTNKKSKQISSLRLKIFVRKESENKKT